MWDFAGTFWGVIIIFNLFMTATWALFKLFNMVTGKEI